MAKILGEDGQIYHLLPLDTFTEPETQRQIKGKSHHIFPGFTYVPCAPLIVSDYDARKPDFILIENNYRSWWIGEVEKCSHSLEGHVLPQVETFKTGYYDDSHAAVISQHYDGLDRNRLQMLVETERPNVLVVADKLLTDWASRLESKGARLALFEVFRSPSHRYLFRVNGYCPSPPALFQTECRVPASMPNLLQIASPAGLALSPKQLLSIMHLGVCSDWSVIVADGNFWLRPVRTHTLAIERRYQLLQQVDGTLELREIGR